MPTPKEAAHWAVDNALKTGALRRPDGCERCAAKGSRVIGQGIRLQAHHADYSKPLSVEWLCAECHKHHHQPPVRAEMQTLTFRLKPHEREEVRRRAREADMTVSDYVRRAIGLRGHTPDIAARLDDLERNLERRLSNLEALANL